MANNGKLDARITVPTGGWDIACTDDGGGPTTVTMPAGEYYHSSVGSLSEDFADALETAINAVMSETWAVSVSDGEGGNGKYTISASGATVTVTFTDTEIRDVMGFTGNLSASTSYTSTNHAKGLWLPSSGGFNNLGGASWWGWWESDKKESITSSGHYFGVMGRKRRILELRWMAETRAKTWIAGESTTGESFEQFLIDAVYGEASGFDTGGPVRWYPDGDDDATYKTYSVLGFQEFKPAQMREDFVGRWVVAVPRMVEVPS